MPTLKENLKKWDQQWDWTQAGDEWSSGWGGSDMQWHFSILPRIHHFLPAPTILEIAPGFGRWTQFLKDACDHLVVIDLTEKCIDACQDRFRDASNIEYVVNDGMSLSMVADSSLDFVFSFDSLVHAEPTVIAAYLNQLATKLKPDGVGVFHHSNLSQHSRFLSRISREGRGKHALFMLAKVHPIHRSWREPTMSAERFEAYAERAGLRCVSQEKINWACRRTIDCISTFTRSGSKWETPNVVTENPRFMREAETVRALAPLYGRARYPTDVEGERQPRYGGLRGA